jgi:hypothetical protein
MPRAYVRLDVHAYDRKVLGIDTDGQPIKGWKPYSPDALVAFYGCLSLADMQPERGIFRSVTILRELLRGTAGLGARYARQVPTLIARGDLVVLGSGRLYVDGWREWQEGDLTVPERMRRYRARKAERNGTGVTAPVTPRVTGDVTAAVTARPSDGDRLAEAVSISNSGGGGGVATRTPRSMTDDDRAQAIAATRELLGSPETDVQRAAVRTLKRLDPDTDWSAELAAAQADEVNFDPPAAAGGSGGG